MNDAARRLGIALPLVQAPVGSATTPALAAAVSEAGGLGTLAGTWRTPEELRRVLRKTAALTSRPIGVNLVLAFDIRQQLDVALEEGVRIISFSWGDPTPWIPRVHAAGSVVLHSIGSVEEAALAVKGGVDVLVAQGIEAGGHVRGTRRRDRLVAEVKADAGGVPVLAAGGIADTGDVREAMRAGADGVWPGTRFVASSESRAHAGYKQRLVEASAAETVLCQLFDIGWPDAPHRVLRNSTVRAWETAGSPANGCRPGEGEVVAHFANGKPILRYEDAPPIEGTTGDVEALSLYAGESVDRIAEILPAAEIVRRLGEALRA
ncbi:MAG TPA: nitronate monooxygenase [Gemmatimonadales bacterium]|nr:nitronate monooxygenase [Gemmatimonadales bacterium]